MPTAASQLSSDKSRAGPPRYAQILPPPSLASKKHGGNVTTLQSSASSSVGQGSCLDSKSAKLSGPASSRPLIPRIRLINEKQRYTLCSAGRSIHLSLPRSQSQQVYPSSTHAHLVEDRCSVDETKCKLNLITTYDQAIIIEFSTSAERNHARSLSAASGLRFGDLSAPQVDIVRGIPSQAKTFWTIFFSGSTSRQSLGEALRHFFCIEGYVSRADLSEKVDSCGRKRLQLHVAPDTSPAWLEKTVSLATASNEH